MTAEAADGLGNVSRSSEAGPVLSIVIVSWNEWPKLKQCLASIYCSSLPSVEILVVDNGSADGTPNLVRTLFPDVVLHCNTRNLGASRALNFGFAHARGDFLLKLDADTELVGDCISQLLDFMRQRPDVEMVAPRTYNTDGSVQETARSFPTALSALFGRRSTLTRWFPNNPVSHRYLQRQFLDATQPFEVDQVGGAFMLFRRSLLSEVGNLDERYYHYWDDTDWCFRIRAAGKRIFCVPTAHVYHHEGNARGKRKSAKRVWMFHYNAYRCYTRWRTWGNWDPRSIAAGIALVGRALLIMAYHAVPRSVAQQPAEPPSQPGSSISQAGS